jgi:hypothetical protein
MLMIVAIGSMVFGAEWLMQPRLAHTATPAAHAAVAKAPAHDIGPRAKVVARADTTPMPAPAPAAKAPKPAVAAAPAAASTQPQATTQQRAPARETTAQASESVTSPAAEKDSAQPEPAAAPTQKASCNVSACAAAYQSFHAEDCTYQPYDGPRRLCEKGARIDSASNARGSSASASSDVDLRNARRLALDARAQQPCNISACSRQYQSFDAATCTYQPYDGGSRRLCTR